ncbi:MAG TPA: universal stress protein [Xanthobacteraceae bacterium]
MSYATLMVHVDTDDADEASQARARLASALADRFQAELIGIAARAPLPFAAEGVVIDPVPMQREIEDIAARLERTADQFRAIAGKGGRQVEWRSALEFPTEFVAREACAADLVIIGAGRAAREPYRALDAGSLILKAGRPVLVAPGDLAALAAKRIAVAWKDAREARRALADALPFLQLADSIELLEVCEWGAEEQTLRRLKDVAGFLARHRITSVTERVLPGAGNAGEVLLRFVADEQADLIVAGAYGHTRLGEWMFGGVTRDLITKSPVCCLLSH